MKYLVFSLLGCLLMVNQGRAQVAEPKQSTKAKDDKYWQFSLRGGLDQAIKSEMPDQVKMPLKGYMGGFSIDKYFGFWGIGVDGDVFKNDAPLYDSTGFSKQIEPYFLERYAASSTKLERYFLGIGPSFKYQSKGNKFTAELNLRGGVTRTDGSALSADALVTSVTGPLNLVLFDHQGYDEKFHAAAKAQVRFSYFPGKNRRWGIQAGAYYLHQFSSEAPFQYTEFQALPKVNVVDQTTALSSYGAFAGVAYRLFDRPSKKSAAKPKPAPVPPAPAPVVKKPAAPQLVSRDMIVHVKDELTGQPLYNAAVLLTDGNSNSQTIYTDKQGMARIPNAAPNSYQAVATLNGIRSTLASIDKSAFNTTGIIERTLYHNDPRFTLTGRVVNTNNYQPEGDALATLTNETNNAIGQATSKPGTGEFRFQLDPESDFSVVGKKAGYMSNIEKVSTKGLKRSQVLYVQIELGMEEAVAGKTITLNNIYYDLNSAAIRNDASSDLKKLITFMNDNPELKVELSAHTDARGSDAYNMKLSQSRAQSVVNYLVKNGITRDRMVAKGYGETKLKNHCANGVVCSEIEHQENRRTEIKVIGQRQ